MNQFLYQLTNSAILAMNLKKIREDEGKNVLNLDQS